MNKICVVISGYKLAVWPGAGWRVQPAPHTTVGWLLIQQLGGRNQSASHTTQVGKPNRDTQRVCKSGNNLESQYSTYSLSCLWDVLGKIDTEIVRMATKIWSRLRPTPQE